MSDLISRQAAIDDIKAVYEWHDTVTEGRILDHLRRLPSAQPEKVCIAKITLSEEQVREAVEKAKSEIVQVLPSAQPERKTGRWIKEGEQMLINLEAAREQYKRLGYPHRTEEKLKCSVCRVVTLVDSGIKYEYCPHCGADMRDES